MKILCTTSRFNKELIPADYELILNPYKRKLTEEEAGELVELHQPEAIIAGVEPLTKKVLQKAKNLKVVSRCGIGLDSVDLDAAKEFGIAVTNTPDGPTLAVAELTLGLVLNLLRDIQISDTSIRNGKWERPMGNLLNGKTVGIIGCGRIGTAVAKLVKAFGCNVWGFDKYVKINEHIEMIPFETLISGADIITLHIPYSEETHNILGPRELFAMKNGAYVINASRGGLIDEEVLYERLKAGELKGAALDCYNTEPYIGPLKELKNVLLTAHIGSYAEEARILQEKQAVENVITQLKKLGVI